MLDKCDKCVYFPDLYVQNYIMIMYFSSNSTLTLISDLILISDSDISHFQNAKNVIIL